MARSQIFVVDTGPDRLVAGRLVAAVRSFGLSVFSSADSLQAGDPWDEIIPRAMKDSDIILVIVSDGGGGGHYALEEVAQAIDLLTRKRAVARVVPVLVMRRDGTLPSAPFGLRRLEPLVLSTAEDGIQGIALRIAGFLKDPPVRSAPVVQGVERLADELSECLNTRPTPIPAALPAEKVALSIELTRWSALCSSTVDSLFEFANHQAPVELEYQLFPLVSTAQQALSTLEVALAAPDTGRGVAASLVDPPVTEVTAALVGLFECIGSYRQNDDGNGNG